MSSVACWRFHPRELARPECGACKGGRLCMGGATPRVLGRQLPPPPPQGASGQQLVGEVVGVQNRGVAPPPPPGAGGCIPSML